MVAGMHYFFALCILVFPSVHGICNNEVDVTLDSPFDFSTLLGTGGVTTGGSGDRGVV
jgi:hypothetical protein